MHSSVMKVVLKIIKHCKEEENSLEPVNGQLVGLVQSAANTLEVTNCFPLYVPETETEDTGWLTVVQCRRRTFSYDHLMMPACVHMYMF